MKRNVVHGLLVTAVVIGMAGCASVSKEEIDQLRSDVSAASATAEDAKQMAADAMATAENAANAANRALAAGNDAQQMASDAQQTADEARAIAADTIEKTELMFKKSMSK